MCARLNWQLACQFSSANHLSYRSDVWRAYAVEDAEDFACAGAECPSPGERAVSLERQTGDEQIVGDCQVQHEAHSSRALDGAGQRDDRQRVADCADDKRHQIQHEDRVPQLTRVYLYSSNSSNDIIMIIRRDFTRCPSNSIWPYLSSDLE